ncbi:asparaginase domain-containing protein, partial [uncultured Ligilactobacillus sp.]
MKKILILHTGGTIAMSEDENGAVAPGKENPLNQFKNPFSSDHELVIENIFNIP